MARFATAFVLCYGAHPEHFALHRRCLDSLRRALPPDLCDVRVWCNEVGDATLDLMEPSWKVYNRGGNTPKYRAMRQMFWEDPTTPLDCEWILWFDDDTCVVEPDYFEMWSSYINLLQDENICYVGPRWWMFYPKGVEDWIRAARWHRGVPPNMVDGKPIFYFAQGSHWWLRTDVARLLSWPDDRLNHNGGDTTLAEAIRQQGLRFHDFNYGVVVNGAPRRGYSEAPAGALDKNLRK